MQAQGVLTCGKHFPGHGDTDEDSHLTLPLVAHDRARLDRVELLPFRELIEARLLHVLMPAHVVYPALDDKLPATYSARVLQQLLRQQLGFEGVVITDDMGMAGALSFGELPEACIEAFAAGCDLLLVCDHHEQHELVIARFGEALAASPALQARAAQSQERIEALARKRRQGCSASASG